MNRIVIGFDGSPGSLDALALGRSLATQTECELVVAAVLTRDSAPTTAGDERAGAKMFDSLFADVQRELGETSFTSRELREHSAAGALSALAERESVDALVIGSSHRGPVGRILLGGVGERLLQGGTSPVLVAPRGFAEQDRGPLRTIGIAFDDGVEARRALEAAAELAKSVGARLIVLCVAEPVQPGFGEALAAFSADELFEYKRKATQEALDAALGKVANGIEARGRMLVGDPADELGKAAEQLDLLVVGSRGYGPVRRTLLGSTSARLIRRTPCPVLVIPRRAESPTLLGFGATAMDSAD